MDKDRTKEEFLETLWHMHERGQDSLSAFKNLLKDDFDPLLVKELEAENLVFVNEGAQTICFKPAGEEYGRRLIRAHRLAERLIRDVLGKEAEQSACEFEHIVSPELVDGICTLLGHPRECPHGMLIPEGECCRRSATSAESSVMPVTQLEVGQRARIAYVHCKNDQQMHKLEDLQIRPGMEITMHQVFPSFVIECQGASIAFDRDIASRIRVWKPGAPPVNDGQQISGEKCGRIRKHRRWGFKKP